MERFLQSLEDFRLRCRGFFDAEVPLICSVGVQLLSQLEQMHRRLGLQLKLLEHM